MCPRSKVELVQIDLNVLRLYQTTQSSHAYTQRAFRTLSFYFDLSKTALITFEPPPFTLELRGSVSQMPEILFLLVKAALHYCFTVAVRPSTLHSTSTVWHTTLSKTLHCERPLWISRLPMQMPPRRSGGYALLQSLCAAQQLTLSISQGFWLTSNVFRIRTSLYTKCRICLPKHSRSQGKSRLHGDFVFKQSKACVCATHGQYCWYYMILIVFFPS